MRLRDRGMTKAKAGAVKCWPMGVRVHVKRLAAVMFGAGVLAVSGASAQDINTVAPRIEQPPAFKSRGVGLPALPKIDRAQPLYLQGDELVYDNNGSRVTARGNVEIYYNDYILTADRVIYDQVKKTLSAEGNVTLKEPSGSVTRSERITLSDDFRDGFVQSLSFVAKDDTRISAKRATRREGNVTEFEDGKFTPCKSAPGTPPLWCISAKRVVHDQNKSTISYRDAAFEIFGVPVLYVPYFEHADPTVKRKSGFLLPGISQSSDLGYMVETPYHFALNPSYDFTFHPRYMSKQGMMWQGEFRQKVAFNSVTGQYNFKFAAIDQDFGDLPTGNADRSLDGWRGSIQSEGQFSLASWWNFGWDVTIESDSSFRRFYKLDNILQTDRVNTAYLTGISDRNYAAITGYHFGGLLFSDESVAESRVHPVFDWNYIVGRPVLGGELSWNVNAVSFTRDQEFQDGTGALRRVDSVTHRASADVNWRRKLTDRVGITYTPFANLRGDVVTYKDVVNPQDDSLVRNVSDSRGTASAGVLLAYPWIKHGVGSSHTIEPIAQIIARASRTGDQSLRPNEDARSLVFDDSNLFEIDKNSGFDRFETGTRANVGMQYTFQMNSGGYARLLAGQSFHLSGTNLYSTNVGNEPTSDTSATRTALASQNTGLDTDRSDYVLGAYIAPNQSFRLLGQGRFDEKDLSLRRADLFALARYGPISGQAAYSFTAGSASVDQSDSQQDVLGALSLQLSDRWSMGGSIRYDIDEADIRQNSLSLRYADECFVLTATYAESRIEDSENGIDRDRAVLLRIELKHLGDFNYRSDILNDVTAVNQ